MAGGFISNEVDARYREAIGDVMADLGKKSVFLIVFPATVTQCPNCVYDPVHKVGSGVYNSIGPKFFSGKVCPVCENKGTVSTVKKRKIPDATISYSKLTNKSENTPTQPGEIPFGFARAKVPVRFHDLTLTAESFTVDGVRYKMVGRPVKRGLKSYVVAIIMLRRDD